MTTRLTYTCEYCAERIDGADDVANVTNDAFELAVGRHVLSCPARRGATEAPKPLATSERFPHRTCPRCQGTEVRINTVWLHYGPQPSSPRWPRGVTLNCPQALAAGTSDESSTTPSLDWDF